MQTVFKTTITVSWDQAGQVLSSLRALARQQEVALKPFAFASLRELVKTYDVQVEGDDAAVHRFAACMDFWYPGSLPGLGFSPPDASAPGPTQPEDTAKAWTLRDCWK